MQAADHLGGLANERAEMDPERLIEEYGAQMLATARRWSASDQDAEDAFQRAAERALTSQPGGGRDELRAWLRTTVKNEALAIVRHRRRMLPGGPAEALPPGRRPFGPQSAVDTDVQAERRQRLRLGGQALRRLKPQEVRALQLQAEGYSYREIAEITSWSATKVNRCLTEGRAAFRAALAGIERGSECDRLAGALAAVAAGTAAAEDVVEVRAHARACLRCRARLRGLRAAA